MRLFRGIIFLLIIFFNSLIINAQSLINSWINYNQQYFKIEVSEDGIYKLTYSQMLSAGIPISTIDARSIQIFHKGEEQYIHVNGMNAAGILDPTTGSIEFYGERTRGQADVPFFDNPINQVNGDINIYSSTAAYFFTWNLSTNNRRMTVANANDYENYSANAQNYCYKNVRTNYTATFYPGSTQNYFSTSEGYFDNTIIGGSNNNVVTKTINLPNIFSSGDSAKIEIAVAGAPSWQATSSIPHNLTITFAGSVQGNYQYVGYQYVRKIFNLNPSELQSSMSFKFSASAPSQNDEYDRNTLSYIDIKYPYSFNFPAGNSNAFYLKSNKNSAKDYIAIKGFSQNGNVFLYDIYNNERISTEKFGDSLKMLANHTNGDRYFYLVNQDGYKTATIQTVSSNNKFTNYLSLYQNPNYIIVAHKNLWTTAQQYATYRQSTGYRVALVDVEQLYNQFGDGIFKHPIGIRNYISTIHEQNPDTELTLFLFGKGNDINYGHTNVLIPAAGYPASDALFTAGLGNTTTEPFAATGRLSVLTEADAQNYLNKVMAYESNPNAEWMKNILHFGGGNAVSEQATFAGYLNGYKATIEDTLFGGFVRTFLKTSSQPIQIAISDSIKNLINNGVTLMTFFGHGYASGFDQNVDFPENYDNFNKYPTLIGNSCYTGDIFKVTEKNNSELWINAQKRGAIAYIATKQQSTAAYLNLYTAELYRNIAYKKYNQTIGVQMKNTIKELAKSNPGSLHMQSIYHDFTLNGDPAIVINSIPKPDLLINNSEIHLIPNQISTERDSFDVKFIVKNIGKAVRDTFSIEITRIYPNSEKDIKMIFLPKCYFADTLIVRLPVNRLISPGLNTIDFKVDNYNVIDEYNENNNFASISFMIRSADFFPIYPYKYAIIPNKNATLIASTGDAFSDENNYRFQIDTTDNFNSPLLTQIVKNSSGGLISWILPFQCVKNRVYYWRIAREHLNPDSLFWKESSFVYEEGQKGWSQMHYFQYKENQYTMLDYNRFARKFSFINVPKVLHCRTIGNPSILELQELGFNIDGSVGLGMGVRSVCTNINSMNIVIIDPETLTAWFSDKYDYGHWNYPMCPSFSYTQCYFAFLAGSGTTVNTTNINNMAAMLNSIPDGYYILAYSAINAYVSNWSEFAKQTFENLGSVHVRNVPAGCPYIFFAKKGQPSSAVEIYGTTTTATIDLPTTYLYSNFSSGSIKSVEIGPAMEWQSLHWAEKALENPTADKSTISVYGINNKNQEQLLIPNLSQPNYDLYNLSQQIDYQQYPKLKLNFHTEDTLQKTPSQLTKWQVKFKTVAETAIDPKLGFVFCCDTIQQGATAKFAVATKNITELDMDSLMVHYWIQNKNNDVVFSKYKKLRPHPAGDILIDTLTFETLDLTAHNTIWVEFNPLNPKSQVYYQPEQFHFNNIAVHNFFVQRDITNPFLDVSFDGRYIMNGELVSARPEILIKLKDENKFLALNDSSIFSIYLADLQEGTEQRIYFANDPSKNYTVEWVPAELPNNNSCKAILKPIFTKDGNYKLKVQAKDMSGNWSATNDYVIDFKVVIESTITHLLNYPNPFSTSTRFVFELTGYQIPDKMRIEIFTVSGKLVKVINLEELGNIRIGRNVTDYSWDGTDMYGDRLANGVYFYRVTTKLDGQEIKHQKNDSDKYFKKEIGKMYLIR